jgi:tuberous sclerosis protein 1
MRNISSPRLFQRVSKNFFENLFVNKKINLFQFNLAKEAWLVNGLIDYFAQTNSYRIVEILVKVQNPHDLMIFNKLQRCLQEQPRQKTVALTLFSHIVRKHPTWLFRVVNHPFLKDLLKMLKVSFI